MNKQNLNMQMMRSILEILKKYLEGVSIGDYFVTKAYGIGMSEEGYTAIVPEAGDSLVQVLPEQAFLEIKDVLGSAARFQSELQKDFFKEASKALSANEWQLNHAHFQNNNLVLIASMKQDSDVRARFYIKIKS